jgi:malonyl CoA-acyl carrier protein transacylase
LAEPRTIAQALGELVEREVDRGHARRLKAGQLDDQQLLDALQRAQQLHDNLAQIVTRLEHRLDRPAG